MKFSDFVIFLINDDVTLVHAAPYQVKQSVRKGPGAKTNRKPARELKMPATIE